MYIGMAGPRIPTIFTYSTGYDFAVNICPKCTIGGDSEIIDSQHPFRSTRESV